MVAGHPGTRMAGSVQNCDDDDQVRNHSEDDAIWEAVDEGLPELSLETGKGLGMTGNSRQGFFHAEYEVGFQVWVAFAIPFLCLRHVSLGNREQFDGPAHLSRRRCLTSGQVDAVMAPVS